MQVTVHANRAINMNLAFIAILQARPGRAIKIEMVDRPLRRAIVWRELVVNSLHTTPHRAESSKGLLDPPLLSVDDGTKFLHVTVESDPEE
jgi:hypothetical protein